MDQVFAILVLGAILLIALGIIFLIAEEAAGIALLVLGIICAMFAFSIGHNDPQKAIENNSVHDTYGVVQEISESKVKVDGELYSFNQVVASKFGTSNDVKIGDVVHLTYLSGAVNDYVAKLNKVTINEENGGK